MCETRRARDVLIELIKKYPESERTLSMPANFCPDVRQALKDAGVKFPMVNRCKFILFYHRNGFINTYYDYMKDDGKILMEDCIQAAFTDGVGKHGNYVLYHNKKFLEGSPDSYSHLLLPDYKTDVVALRRRNFDYLRSKPYPWNGECPLFFEMKFPSRALRNRVYVKLRTHGVHACIHWVDTPADTSRILDVPVSHWLNEKDMQHIICLVREETNGKPPADYSVV